MALKIVWALLDAMTIVVLWSGLYLWWRKRQQTVEDMIVVDASRGLALEGPVWMDGWTNVLGPVIQIVAPRLRPGGVVMANNVPTIGKPVR